MAERGRRSAVRLAGHGGQCLGTSDLLWQGDDLAAALGAAVCAAAGGPNPGTHRWHLHGPGCAVGDGEEGAVAACVVGWGVVVRGHPKE